VSPSASSPSVRESRQTLTSLQDHVVASDAARQMLAVQVIGTESAVLFCLGSSTEGGNKGRILDPAPSSQRGGGYWQINGYTGPVALRAIVEDVSVAVEIVEIRR